MQNEFSTKTQITPKKKIIALDFQKRFSEGLIKVIQSDVVLKDYQIFLSTNMDHFLLTLKEEKPSLVLLVNQQQLYDVLDRIELILPAVVVLAVADRWSYEDLVRAINHGKIFRTMNSSADEFEIKSVLHEADEEANFIDAHRDLKKIFAEQNKNLEVLNSDLEKMVNEKTLDIQISKDEIDNKIQKIRQLTSFIKEISNYILFEEIMNLVSRDVRKFAHVASPFLILQSLQSHLQIFGFSQGQYLKVEMIKDFEFPNDIDVSDKYVAAFLANVFGRPMIKIISIPLEIDQIQRLGMGTARALLCVEHSMSDYEVDQFMSHLSERIKPLSMAIDRAFLQRELMNQYFRWEKTFDGIKDPIAIIDYSYGLIRSNKKFSDRVVQKKCYQEFAKRESPCEGCPMETSLKYGRHADGQILVNGRFYEVNSYPIKDSNQNRFTTVINQYIDVTQSRELYARMLQNEKMSGIGMLAGNIAHELNNPLTGIRSLTQILIKQTESNPQLQGDLKEVEKAAGRSQQIIRNLLEFSSGSSQSKQLISIDEVVEKTMPMLKALMRSHRLMLSLETKSYKVLAEPHLLQQVVFNLINNACQAMGDAGTLILKSQQAPDGYIELIVEDNGPGIPQDLHEKIFEPFFTTKKEGQGTGLGLSLSRDVVRRMDGDILLESHVGKGSRFIIRLPIAQDRQ